MRLLHPAGFSWLGAERKPTPSRRSRTSHLFKRWYTSTFPRGEVTGGAFVAQIRFQHIQLMPGGTHAFPAASAMAPHDQTPLPNPVPGAVFRRLPEGGVLFSTETEVYFGVGVVGAAIWELLPPATKTVEEMVSILASKYHDVSASQIRTDVERFLSELLSNGLVAHVATRAKGDHPIP